MWDETYSKKEFHYGVKPNDFLVETFDLWKHSQSALCIGAGEGRNASYLLEKGIEVSALDLSKVGLEKFSQRARQKGLSKFKTIYSKLEDYDFKNKKFELITAIWFHGNVNFKNKLFKTVKEQLAPNGLF